jgi:predicted ATPase
MPELTADFQSLPEEHQQVIRLAQDTHKITVAPLQLLVGGWSGAVVYLVSVSSNETGCVEHCILKLDRKGKSAKSDEVTRHNAVMNKSTPDFTRDHIAELAFDRVERESVIAIFYRIAGQSLLKYLPLSRFRQQNQLKSIFTRTNTVLLNEWNASARFEQAVHPQKVLGNWLGFRLDTGGNIEEFLQTACRVDPDIPGFLINGNVFPNPLVYARKVGQWGKARPIDIAVGFIHGDLNTNNILVKFSDNSEVLEGYYLIDFALFKENMPLLYDQRYLEMSYLVHSMSQVSFAECVELLTLMSEVDIVDPRKAPIEMSGVSAVIESARGAFAEWVQEKHPSVRDDLWGQYWLAGVAAGLSYTHKAGQPGEGRLAGLIYAAANLKRYAQNFKLLLPTNVELLYDENQPQADSAGRPKARQPKCSLPAQPTAFIGRRAEVTAVRDLLIRDPQEVRLVTLTGPGGTGKTRLALQTASELADRFTDGIYFIDLASSREPEAIPPAIARTVGLRETSDRPLMDDIKAQLRARTMLLLLDNFEQVASAAPMMWELLQDCPHLKLLVTSREALHLRGEHIHPVPPLGLPGADFRQQTIEQLTQYEAVRLFIERALAVKPDFEVTNENAQAVAEICFRLDGLPLAIELAAARIRLFSPQALLERVGCRLSLLRGGARDLPVRQQTLRDTIDWSYELLDADERRLFGLLSIFASCTFEEVEVVGARITHLDGMRMGILDGLESLVDKSLIRQVSQGTEEPRLMMLETIREYAVERLEQDSEFSVSARRAFARYFAEFTQRQWEHLTGQGRDRALREMESEIENVRTAWRFWVEGGDLEQLTKFVNSLWLLYDARGWYHDTVGLANDLLNVLVSTPSTPERMQQEIILQTSLARALMATKGYTEEVERAYARALDLCDSAGEIPQLFPVLRGLASFYILLTEHEKSIQMGERILQLADQLDDLDMKMEGNMVLGYNLGFLQDPQAGLDLLEKAVASYDLQRQRVGRFGFGPYPGVVSLTVSALFLWMLGYPDRAHKRAADSILLARKMNHPYSIIFALFHNGLLNVWLKNHETARESAQAVLELAEAHGFRIWGAVGSCLLGAAMVGLGSAETGLALIEGGLNAYRGLKTPPVFWPLLLHLCAGAYGAASKPQVGLQMMNDAIEIGSSSPARTLASEFLIVKAELLLMLSSGNAAEAEVLYQQAVLNAREVHAPMLELRAAMRLSRLWHEQGNKGQAQRVLNEAYSRMAEGFTTADLKEASALLVELSE